VTAGRDRVSWRVRARDLSQLVELTIAQGRAGAVAGPDLPRAARRARGAFWTPPALAAFLAQAALAPLLQAARPRHDVPALRVLDPAAGDGRLLRAALELMLAHAAPRTPRAERRLREAITRSCLRAIERDPAQAEALRTALPGLEVLTADALVDARVAAFVGEVDAVVANPPYQRAGHLRAQDPATWRALRGRFAATGYGEWDLSSAFVERCLALLSPRGRAALIVPSRWLTSRTAGPLRALLARERAVAEVIDFGSLQLFPGATTYASIVTLARAPVRRVQVARPDAAGWQVGRFTPPAGTAPWIVSPRPARWPSGRVLGDVARIVKGAGTCADAAFVVSPAEAHALESAALRPCVRGRDVEAWGTFDPAAAPRCVVPYTAGGAPVPLTTVRARWPRALAHLMAGRPGVGAADVARFGRPQNLALHLGPAPRVVFPDVARAPRAMLVPGGTLVLDSAYAAYGRPDGGAAAQPEVLLALLASPHVGRWLDERAAPLRGGYRRMKTAILAPLPLPAEGPWLDAVIGAVRAGERGAAEAALASAYGWA
jgi:hypothetical protein